MQGNSPYLFMTDIDNPRCGLLTADGLCEAHARYGVDYTPLTCQSFPRMLEETSALRMESASPACPVIARRVLFGATDLPLFIRTTLEEKIKPADENEGMDLLLTDALDGLMQENQFPIGVRLFWLAERVATWHSKSKMEAKTQATLDLAPHDLRQQLEWIDARRRQGDLRPDPVIAGSFWNTLYQLGHARGLLPELDKRKSALFAGLRGLPPDRRRFYAGVYAELLVYREKTLFTRQDWYPPAANRLLQLLFLNTGFPWQPSLGDLRMSFVHAVILYALIHFRLWLGADEAAKDAEALVEATYRTGRAFGHNTLILERIRENPALLQLDRYHHTLLDL